MEAENEGGDGNKGVCELEGEVPGRINWLRAFHCLDYEGHESNDHQLALDDGKHLGECGVDCKGVEEMCSVLQGDYGADDDDDPEGSFIHGQRNECAEYLRHSADCTQLYVRL